jgi:hypothetical protein
MGTDGDPLGPEPFVLEAGMMKAPVAECLETRTCLPSVVPVAAGRRDYALVLTYQLEPAHLAGVSESLITVAAYVVDVVLRARSTERERVQGSVWCTKLKLLDILSHHEYFTSVIVRSG